MKSGKWERGTNTKGGKGEREKETTRKVRNRGVTRKGEEVNIKKPRRGEGETTRSEEGGAG